jgi:O-antigen ligase
MKIFYSIDSDGSLSKTAFHQIGNLKRINSVLNEPSLFGHFITTTLFFLLISNDGHDEEKGKSFIKLLIIIFSIIILVISLSFTGYIGLILILILYLIYKRYFHALFFLSCGLVLMVSIMFFSSYELLNELYQIKQNSIEERLYFSIVLPFESISKMPIFGLGIGTDRPIFLPVRILSNVGFLGTAALILHFNRFLRSKRKARYYLYFLICIGVTVPDIHMLFMWIYFGLLSNKNYE